MRDSFQLHLSAVTVKRRSPRRRLKPETAYIKVDARVWQAALRLAEDDVTRIEVLSPTEVVIHNKRKWRNA